MPEADFRLMTEATGQRIAAALEALSGTGAAAAAARTNLDVYSTGEVDAAIQQSTALKSTSDGTSAWVNAHNYIIVDATYELNTYSDVHMTMLIPKASLPREQVYQMGDKYNTGAQMHLQTNITYAGMVTTRLYENANEKTGVTITYYYQ